ncbi:MAG: homoserine kinase [Anaerolineales bacterium]|nr:homoserine kinase [Anaerolineales bacterium]
MTASVRRAKIRIPATSANLGPGFDCMALALDLWNEVTIANSAGGVRVSVKGEGAGLLPQDRGNRVALAALQVFEQAGWPEAEFSVDCLNRIPVASGMGSSAAAAVGGLMAANTALGLPYSRQNLIRLCLALEAHADNAAAAFAGGLVVLGIEESGVLWRRYELPPMRVCVVVPEKRVPTSDSRSFLPETVAHRDAAFNLGRALLTAEALRSADYRLLAAAMQDRLHQPYRLARLPGIADILQAATQAGAAAALSGAGPGVIAFAECGQTEILNAMLAAARERKLDARGFLLNVSNAGADEIETRD